METITISTDTVRKTFEINGRTYTVQSDRMMFSLMQQVLTEAQFNKYVEYDGDFKLSKKRLKVLEDFIQKHKL